MEELEKLLQEARGALALMRQELSERRAAAAELEVKVLHQEGAVAGIEVALERVQAGEIAPEAAEGGGREK